METSGRILVVDDDREIRTLLAEYLATNGYAATGVADGPAMRKALQTSDFDLIVLDLLLPGEDGLTICQNLRAQSDIPVIMLTARGASVDRIIGLEMGADDYLPKPFEPRELVARIKSVLRRGNTRRSVNLEKMHFGSWTLDLIARHLVGEDGIIVTLSGAEYRLLRTFLEHPNRVLNRDQLLNLTSNSGIDAFDRSIDLQVSRLRQRLGEDARSPALIKTVRNEGYIFTGAIAAE